MAVFAWTLSMATVSVGQTQYPPVDTNPLTGVALDGYDPVSYFTDPEPLLGSEEFEFMWAGVPWHFANGANMEIFKRTPDIYAPQYGGHGAMGMARGFLAQSDPRYYTVFKQRLFVFYSAANREAFLMAPDAAALEGQGHWHELVGGKVAEQR